jgi:hypothetical protein
VLFDKNFLLTKKKAKTNKLINFCKKKTILNTFYKAYSLKSSFCLVSIKKMFNSNYYGIFKTILGGIFISKISNGSFLGDFFKNLSLPIKLLKKNFLGSYSIISNLVIYSLISNVFYLKNKPQLANSSGTYCQLLEIKNNINLGLIKLPSGIKKYIKLSSICITGRNSNIQHKYEVFSKASFFFYLGRKPNVRGVAKNPIDHPHGGRTKTSQPEVSP